MQESSPADRVVVVGAGISGLATARALAAAGRSVLVLERARGVGGRCATRRIAGDQPVDFGVAFLHGREPEFLAALAEVPGAALPGWPSVILGGGRPCQPEAFAAGEQRLAFVDGVTAFPRHLARDLDVRTGARVTGLTAEGATIRLAIEGEGAEPIVARTVVLALAVEQSRALIAGAGSRAPGLATVSALLTMVASTPCLTLIAAYPDSVPAPAFHVSYPDDSRILQVISHDSSKRVAPAATVLVYQAHARWSREHLDPTGAAPDRAASDVWARALLAEAARLLGPWAAEPTSFQAHRWRHARTDRSAELGAPILLHLPGDGAPGPRLGFAGELFSPGGGVESAWMSGTRLARMILAEDRR
jgi:hypothetical protein